MIPPVQRTLSNGCKSTAERIGCGPVIRIGIEDLIARQWHQRIKVDLRGSTKRLVRVGIATVRPDLAKNVFQTPTAGRVMLRCARRSASLRAATNTLCCTSIPSHRVRHRPQTLCWTRKTSRSRQMFGPAVRRIGIGLSRNAICTPVVWLYSRPNAVVQTVERNPR